MTWIAACSGARGTYQEVVMAPDLEGDRRAAQEYAERFGPCYSDKEEKFPIVANAEPIRRLRVTDDYRWELINTLRSAQLADLLATVPEVNQRTFIDAAQLLEEQASEIVRLNNLVDAYGASGK